LGEQETVAFAQNNETEFFKIVQNMTSKESERAMKSKISELNKADARIAELDKIINVFTKTILLGN